MTIPALTYSVSSQNHRVSGYEVPGEEFPRCFSTDNLLDGTEMDDLIWASYRQIFNEQQILEYNRQPYLESQLRNGQITVRYFIRGLAVSDSFRQNLYEVNNNYRFVEICIQRIFGRNVYSDRETLSWSIVLATKGLHQFIDDLLSSNEYMESFGDNIVPFQRRRILPQQSIGEKPFARMARYGSSHLDRLRQMGSYFYTPSVPFNAPRVYRVALATLSGSSVVLAIFTLIWILPL